jgi:hypothetical protein
VGLFRKAGQQDVTLTGPDYLIGAAEQLKIGVGDVAPFSPPRIVEDVVAFQDEVIKHVMEGEGIGTVPDLLSHELAAMFVFREAVAVALARRDQQSLYELSTWGVAVMFDFARTRPTSTEIPPPP